MPRIKTLKDKHGNTVYEVDYRVMVDGVSMGSKKRLHGVTIHEARHFMNTRVNEIYAGKYVKKKKKYRISKLIHEYLNYSKENKAQNTYKQDDLVLNRFLEYVGDLDMENLSGFMLEKYKHERLKKNKKSSANIDIIKIKAFTSWCEKVGYIETNPFKHVRYFKEDRPPVRVLSAGEKVMLLENANPRTRLFIELALNTGMRHGEILNLRWDDIDFKNGSLFVRTSKTGDSRTIPINSHLLQVLLEAEKDQKCDWIISHNGNKMATMKKGFAATVHRAGIPYARVHDLRHTFITDMQQAKVDIRTIMEFSGHKTFEMFKRYSHPQPDHMKEAIESLVDTRDQKNFGRILETLRIDKKVGEDK
ncbi:MAG: site-specific integrase [Deltaproteobacteria bacterium]|nr:site-specific integrase [Candidatus Zymogenaceae bacterium]